MSKLRIGLPQALVYYYYFPFWEKFFTSLGFEVVVSEPTNGKMLEKGIKVTVHELCVPIKIFNAHVINLMEKNVDYIFVPRFISVRDEYFCPKFLGLVEMVKFSIPHSEDKLLTFDISVKKDDYGEVSSYYQLADKLNITKKQIKSAYNEAKEYFEKFRALSKQGWTINEVKQIINSTNLVGEGLAPPVKSELTIGVMGYVYNVYDKFVSMDILKRLREKGIKIVTFEMLDDKIIENPKEDKNKPLFWIFARKIYNAGRYLIQNKMIDGMIHVTAFACGPDSVIGKMFETDFMDSGIPFMTIRVDEHTGENHLQTRIEAFTDMLTRKKKRAANN